MFYIFYKKLQLRFLKNHLQKYLIRLRFMLQLFYKNKPIRLEMLWKFTMDMSYDLCSNIDARMLALRNFKCRSKNTLVLHLHVTLVRAGMNGDGGQTVHKRFNAFIASLNPSLIITKRTAQEHSRPIRGLLRAFNSLALLSLIASVRPRSLLISPFCRALTTFML